MFLNKSIPRVVWRLTLAVGLLALSQGASAESPERKLCIYEGYTDNELARYSPDQTGGFSLSFVHSVSLTPVLDTYEIRQSGIHQTAEIFEAHGAGLPSFAGDVGQTGWHSQNGKFVLEMDRQFSRIQLRIQREYLNTLHIAHQELILADLEAGSVGLEICAKGEN